MKSSIAPAQTPFAPPPALLRGAVAGQKMPARARAVDSARAAWSRPRQWLIALALGSLSLTCCALARAQSTEEPVERQITGVSRDRTAIKLQSDAIASIRTLLDGKRTSEALQVAEKALRQFPANVQMRFLYGVALSDSGDTDQAIGVFTELTQSHPELAEPYNNLAVLYASTGNLEAARDALEQAAVAVPDYPLAAENLGDLYVRLAVQAYQKGVANETANATIRRKLVQARELLTNIESSSQSTARQAK